MAHEISIDLASGIAVVTMHGEADLAAVLDAQRDLAPNGSWVSDRRLWDLREAQLTLSAHDVETLARTGRSYDAGRPARLAIVAVQDLGFGLSRIHEVYRKSETTQVRVFRDIDDARRWLLED